MTYTSFSISLRLLMPFQNVSAQLILYQRLAESGDGVFVRRSAAWPPFRLISNLS